MGKGDEKSSRHFKWLRRLINRLRFRHSKFKDGKYTKRNKDIEKWREDSDLTAADYPDYRWQVVTKGNAKRMVPSMVESDPEKAVEGSGSSSENHHHNHGHKCACNTLKELGMVHYEPKPQKTSSTRVPKSKAEATTTTRPSRHQKSASHNNHGSISKTHNHEHDHDPGHKCACSTLEELGMVWHEPKPKKCGLPSGQSGIVPSGDKRTVTAELHKSPAIEDILAETIKEIRIGKDSINQRFQTSPLYKPLGDDDDVPDEYPYLQKACESRKKQQVQGNATAGQRYVPLPSTSMQNQNDIQLDLTEVTVPVDKHTAGNTDNSSIDPFSNFDGDDHNLQAESENDKNHLKAVKGFNSEKSKKEKVKNNAKKASSSPRKPKTPKHRRSLRQRAERKLRKYTVPKGYHKLKEDDVDEDIMRVEQDLNVRKERRKQLKKQNTPEWMMAEETLVLRQMSNVNVQQPQDNDQNHPPQRRNKPGGRSLKSAPMPRGSPSARRGSPRHVLYQMQMQKAGKLSK